MDMSSHSVDANTLNEYIDTLNRWTRDLAQELSLQYLDTAPLLKNSDGFLKNEFVTDDGYHLTREAYIEILSYIKAQKYGG
jgi:lysophospholipase L1-like esterase